MRESGIRTTPVTRRRFIAVSAAIVGACAVGAKRKSARAAQTFTWRGIALGANASLTLQHGDEAAARSAIASCLAEVARLEAIFSLYKADSAIAALNANGRLDDAPADLRRLLADALRLSGESNGAFDPTVQPLWQCYADHFSAGTGDPAGPSAETIARARNLINWRDVAISAGSIVLARPGMAITLNGMAQGYITDRVGDLLRTMGFSNVLVNMGEQLALGPKWDGEAWQVQIAEPYSGEGSLATLSLTNGAVATSSYTGFSFDPAGRFGHIIESASGRPAQTWQSVTVLAPGAARADGLSTAIAASGTETDWRPVLGSARALVQPVRHGAVRWL